MQVRQETEVSGAPGEPHPAASATPRGPIWLVRRTGGVAIVGAGLLFMRWLMMRLLAAHAARRWRLLVAVLLLLAGQANSARAATRVACQPARGVLRASVTAWTTGARVYGAALVVAPAAHPRADAGQAAAPSSVAAACQADSAVTACRTGVPLPPASSAPVLQANVRVPASISIRPQVPPPRLG